MQEYQYFVAHEFSEQDIIDLRRAIEEAFEGTGLKPYYADLEVRPVGIQGYILEKIKEKILTAQFGIYDITNIEKPNVFIELAFAMATDKPHYIICKKNKEGKTEIPADLQGLGRIEYTAYGELTRLIKKLIVKPEVEKLNKIKMRAKVREEYKKLPEEDFLKKCARIYQAEETLFHNFGNEVEDKDAYNRMAWHANLSKIDHVSYGPFEELPVGPFEELPVGTYIAFFKMKIDDNSSTNKQLLLDVYNKSKGIKLSLRSVSKNEFYFSHKYQFFEVEFEYQRGILEYRVYNIVKGGNLWIDYIAVIKLA